MVITNVAFKGSYVDSLQSFNKCLRFPTFVTDTHLLVILASTCIASINVWVHSYVSYNFKHMFGCPRPRGGATQ